MPVELRRSLSTPLHYWRTALLVLIVGLSVATLSRDTTAVLLATLACTFVFASYERRRWIVVPPQHRLGDAVLRVAFALIATYTLSTPHIPVVSLLTKL